jgi:acetylglutamate kinase
MDQLTSQADPHDLARRAPVIVKVGGTLLDEPEKHQATLDGIAALHADAQRRGAGVVLVHGGGVLVDRHLARLGVTTQRIDGIRVTPPDVVEEIVGVLAGRVNTRLVGLLASAGVSGGHAPRTVGLSLGDGGLCSSRKATHYSFDPGAVGEIVGGDPALIHTLLAGGFLPIVSSIGLDANGGFLNINADDAAAAIARITKARELVLLTDVPGVLDRSGAVIPSLDRERIDALIADGTIGGGMIAKVRGALDAADRARVPVTIASWKDPSSVIARRDGGAGPATCTKILPASTPSLATASNNFRMK